MKVLVVGGGGREHALCWKIARSPLVTEVVCAPGNAGTARIARNVEIAASDIKGLVALAVAEAPELVVIGPEEPLALGLADKLREKGMKVFGPGKSGARLEASKAFAKELLERNRIPSASYRQFDRSGAAKSYLEACKWWPQVVKADGLASGKGVFVCQDAKEGQTAIDAIMEEKRMGAAGERVVIEEFLEGEEVSVLAITDGETILILEPVTDHKQVGEGDTGPNTGGMGAVSPVVSLTRRLQRQIEQRVLVPTVHALKHDEIEFRGVLFVGLMMTDGGPKVLEYNVRFGDPELQALVRRFEPDLVPYLVATAEGKLGELDPPTWNEQTCVGVVCATTGYPGATAKGDVVRGIEQADALDEVVTFHAGTRAKNDTVVTDGGRVLCVTALGEGLDQARARAYEAVDAIRWQGKFCRRDIGAREAARRELVGESGERPDGRHDRGGDTGHGTSTAAGRGAPPRG